MADKHPYVQGPGGLIQAVTHFRKSFPGVVDASTLKKLAIARNNESYVLNVLRFLSFIDQEGSKTPEATKIFNLHDDAAFSKAIAPLVATAYSELFKLHGDGAWDLDNDALITFFRTHDQTTAVVGKLQASTFKALGALAGHGDIPAPKISRNKPQKSMLNSTSTKDIHAARTGEKIASPQPKSENSPGAVGLTVRIEINLPSDGNQETYDRIFKSIRENLLNGR